MIDLPRLPDGKKMHPGDLHEFGDELMYFLRRQGIDRDVRDGLLNFDFRPTEKFAFVHTVGGSHFGDEAERTGLPGLSRGVGCLGLESEEDLHLDFATSSIGSLKDAYLGNLYAAARGVNIFERAESINSKKKSNFFSAPTKSQTGNEGIRDKIQIYFPTYDTVRSSKSGAVGSICFKRSYWESSTFPNSTLRDYQSTRSGLLSHNKILYARGTSSRNKKMQRIAWAYVGSANISESAWGSVSYNQKEKAWKITCRNWECGVLIPASREGFNGEPPGVTAKKEEGEDSETESESEEVSSGKRAKPDLLDMSVFENVVAPPFVIPGAAYGKDQEPWFFDEWNR